ncbi:glucoamylase family protein [Kosmotoga pacifica]|uniref:glucoamylase family protein n=1 Tax=Kosmotoga pacifica TaxID=1330330 RepID=UPI00069A2200|nr:glucoamylase family protein [Kosmotoga pacifica]
MKYLKLNLFLFLLLTLSVFGAMEVVEPFDSTAALSNDNTGALFLQSSNLAVIGKYSVKVLPSGEAPETKIAITLEGDPLSKLAGKDILKLSVFVSPGAETKPNKFFLGMADVKDGWAWIDGVFAETEIKDGWNTVVYRLSKPMQNIKPDGKYTLYFSFFEESEGTKTPLADAFYVDALVADSTEELTERVYIWGMDTEEEISGFSNDNTGAVFSLSKKYIAQGIASMEVKPSGKAPETKVALQIPEEKVADWIEAEGITMNLFVPYGKKPFPTKFFMGIADLTEGWNWVDGVFSVDTVSPGWNRITFEFTDKMRDLKTNGKYMVYLAFFTEDENGKVPLQMPFYVDGLYVVRPTLGAEEVAEKAEVVEKPVLTVETPEGLYIWSMDTEKEISTFSNDNTGAVFELDTENFIQGTASMKVIPSGNAIETKVALNIPEEMIKAWANAEEIVLNLYIPEGTKLPPSMFFMGMADLSDGWAWVDGVFSETEIVTGWNQIVYVLSDNMKKVKEGGKYTIYLAFAAFDETNNKVPLTESFNIDGLFIRVEEQVVRDYIWSMDTPEEISGFDNDNTGATLELSDEFVVQGTHSMKVVPSGEALETKVAMDIPQDKIELWSRSNKITMNLYIPEGTELIPTMFFFGMADLTEGWAWVGGVFSNDEPQYGWNQISFELAGSMKEIKPGNKYKVYLAFAGFDAEKNKIPLTEPFYIDGLYVETTKVITFEDRLKMADSAIVKEVNDLLDLDDDDLLAAVEKKAFYYFWNEANPENGLIRDRTRKDSPASIAAVGFGLTAIPVGIENGWISREEGYERVLTTLKTFAEGKVEGKNGFFYHFVDMNTGKRAWNCELSSIDTALLMAGVLFVKEYFAGTEVADLADQLYRAVNWQWMLTDDGVLSMGWKPEGGFLGARWDSFNEGILAYILAIGSPTYPIPAESWDKIYRPIHDTYISLPQETLFVYQYPNVWVDFRNKEDKYANYFNNAEVATRYNWLFTFMKRFDYETYDIDVWGLSACDGPNGYKAYGAAEDNHDGTIAPYASIASIVFTPDLSLSAIRGMLEKYGPIIWGKYGFVSGFNADANWVSEEFVGIDVGDIVLMIENYRSELIWKYFMKNEYIQNSLKALGFVEKEADYAVTPWYQEEFEKLMRAPAEKVAYAIKAEKPVIIDGDLTEWEDVQGYVVNEEMNVPAGGIKKVDKSKQILHSTFYVMWDEENLYMAAKVYDEYLVINIEPTDLGAFYRTDSVEFYIDPSRAGSDAGIMKLAILPFDTAGNPQIVRHEDANPGKISDVAPDIKVATKRTDYGYDLELMVPVKYLNLKPAPDMSIGFCYTIHNSNKKDAGLGEYVRENIISWNNLPEIWANPEDWGTLTLK